MLKKNNLKLENFIVNLPTNKKTILEKINKNQNGIIFVKSENKLLGSITDGDIRRYILKNENFNTVYKNSSLINFKVRFVRNDYNRNKILNIFFKSRPEIKCLPVVNSKKEIIEILNKNKLFPIPLIEPSIEKEEYNNILECLKSGWISSAGYYVKKFENDFKKYIGGGYCVSSCNGTAAITLALLSFNIGKGDEVIVPNFTFAASINAIIATGAKPVIADINKNNWLIDNDEIQKLITKKTKAILIVHIYGIVFKFNKLRNILKKKKRKIFVIEDTAEGLGSKLNKKQIGLSGDCSTFSFYANKNITTGEGGMSVFENKKYYNQALKIRNQGRNVDDRYFWHSMAGANFRMTNLQASIGCAQIKKINKFQTLRKKVFSYYDKKFINDENISILPKPKFTENSYWLYTILIKNFNEKKRNLLIESLKNNGIETRPGFYPLNIMPGYKKFSRGQYKVSHFVSSKTISLPSSPNLKKNEINRIVNIFYKNLTKLINL